MAYIDLRLALIDLRLSYQFETRTLVLTSLLRLGQVRLGQVRLGQVRLGQVRLKQKSQSACAIRLTEVGFGPKAQTQRCQNKPSVIIPTRNSGAVGPPYFLVNKIDDTSRIWAPPQKIQICPKFQKYPKCEFAPCPPPQMGDKSTFQALFLKVPLRFVFIVKCKLLPIECPMTSISDLVYERDNTLSHILQIGL